MGHSKVFAGKLVMQVARSPVGAALVGAAFVACADPDLPSDLKRDGPPDVTTVLVASDLRTSIDPGFPASPFDLDRLIETATHCRIGDARRPAVVNLPTISTYRVCPDDLAAQADAAGVAQAAPPSWYVRIVFDELLDPSIEELIPELDAMGRPTGRLVGSLRASHPVELRCDGAAIDYDGYYVPNGNRLSWPVGPALVIQPSAPTAVATGAGCEVEITDRVRNKRGELVPEGQRSYTFELAEMALRFTDPDPEGAAPGTIELATDTPVRWFWTAAVGALPAASDIHVFAGPNHPGGAPDLSVCSTGGLAVPAASLALEVRAPEGDAPPETTTALVLELGLTTAAPARWAAGTTYRVEIGEGAEVAAQQGGPPGTFPDGYLLCFHTPG